MNIWLRYGAIAASALSVLMFAPYFIFGVRPEWMEVGELVGYGSMLLCMGATWFAMRRERERRGGLRYGQAFAVGVGVSAVAALVFGIATFGFYSVVGDTLPQAIYDFYADQIRDGGGSEAEIARQLGELEQMRPMFFDIPLQAGVMFATVFVIGVVESAVGAWFARSRPAR